MKTAWYFPFFLALHCLYYAAAGQNFNPGPLKADSWEKVLQKKQGTVSAVWYDIEPFIYPDKKGKITGVEYEIMEAFGNYLRARYGVDLTINWINAKAFENIYPYIKQAKQPGIFGWSFYSITDQRKKEVAFSLPYMPDLNVLVTNNSRPYYTSNQEFVNDLKYMTAYTMAATTMEEDVNRLKTNFYKDLIVSKKLDDYKVLEEIAYQPNAFGYVPLSIYITALQKGIKVKRQQVLMARREGFAAILPINSDWVTPMNEYFSTPEFKMFANNVIRKYLGSDVSDLIFEVSLPDSLRSSKSDINLLTLEKEIVTQRLIESAVQIQKERNLRSLLIFMASIIIVVVIFIYRRVRDKQKINRILQQRNEVIVRQKKEIELMNRKLELKVLQAQLNPHFIFNSMNAIQYFAGINDKKGTLNYISGFSRFLRELLKTASSLSNSVRKEAEITRQYLQLEKQRFYDKFDFKVAFDESAELSTAVIPALLVQSFAENALYHGVLNRSNGGGFIWIDFRMDAGNLYVTVEDNGVGRSKAAEIMNKKGMNDLTANTNFIKERIDLINHAAAEKIETKTVDLMNGNNVSYGTKITIMIPGEIMNKL